MIPKSKTGYTLPELLVTIFISTIAVSLILGTYTVVFRVWNRYNLKMEAGNNAWLCYGRVQGLFSRIDGLKMVSGDRWDAFRNAGKYAELRFNTRRLVFKDTALKWEAEVDSFSLKKEEENGDVWVCSITCRKGKEKAGIVWRTICSGEWSDTLLPVQ
jgi:prepilin-type N-terminal cleavage/methylation domain-containing protein